jgi:hypothetical protein
MISASLDVAAQLIASALVRAGGQQRPGPRLPLAAPLKRFPYKVSHHASFWALIAPDCRAQN